MNAAHKSPHRPKLSAVYALPSSFLIDSESHFVHRTRDTGRRTIPQQMRARTPNIPHRNGSFFTNNSPSKRSKQQILEEEEETREYISITKPHMYILRTLKMRPQIERDGTPKSLQCQLFSDRMQGHLRRDESESSNKETLTPTPQNFYLSSRHAELKRLEDQQNYWVRRRHKSDTVMYRVQECLKALHSLLDFAHTGTISGKDLIAQLLSLGLSTDPTAIAKVILAIYGAKEIASLRLSLEQILELSKVDRTTDKLLAFLSVMAAENSHQGPPKRTGTSLSPSRLSRAADPSSTSWRDGNLSLADYLTQLKRLWSDICGPGNASCEFEQMATLLTQLSIFPDKLEVRRAFPEQGEGGDVVTFPVFQDVFARNLFKGALVTLSHRLAKGIGGLMTPKMVISLYQRRLLLAGLHGAPNLSREEGLTTLHAVEEYSRQQANP